LSQPDRQAGWSAVTRSLFLYLFVAWLLIRYGGSGGTGLWPSELVSIAILAGFPLAALVAARLSRGASPGRWGVTAIAVAAASLPALVSLQWQGRDAPAEEIVLTPAVAGPDSLANADLTKAHEGLRLRVRGLSVKAPGSGNRIADGAAAEILLVTSVRDGSGGEELVISATLVSSDTGSVIWRAEYTGDPRDMVAVRRLLIRALTEAMSLTREGVSGGQTV